MNNMIKYFIALTTILVLAACTDDEPDVKDPNDSVENPEDDVEIVTPDFMGDKFENPVHLDLLKELDICDVIEGDSTSYFAACSPKNFEIIEYKGKGTVEDAFILHTKAAIRLKGQDLPLPVRHVLIFERENGALVRVNGFRGELNGMRDGEDGVKELIISIYLKDDDSVFDCLFKYEKGKYSFKSVEGIDWGEGLRPIKANMKDSISADIYNSLMTAQLIF